MQNSVTKIDPDLETINNVCSCLRVFGIMFTGFMYIFMILVPWIAEIIIVSQQSEEHRIITLLVCGVVQTIISIYGGLKMGVSWFHCVNTNTKTIDYVSRYQMHNDIWCGSLVNYKSLFSAGYIIYFLPQWVATNMIIAWVLLAKISLPLYVHILLYTPLLSYFISLSIGFAYAHAIRNNDYIAIV